MSSKTRTSQGSLKDNLCARERVCAPLFLFRNRDLCPSRDDAGLLKPLLCWGCFESATGKCSLLVPPGRGCWKFELPADLLGIPLRNCSNSAAQDGGGQRRFGRRSAVGARLGVLPDLYEPYFLKKKMSGNLTSENESCAIISQNEFRDDLKKIV